MLAFSIVLTTSTNAMIQSIAVLTGQSMIIALAFYTTSKQTQSNHSKPEKNHSQLQQKHLKATI